MKTIKNLTLGVLSIAAALFATVSCVKENITAGRNTGSIALKVTSEADLATKAMDRVPETYLADDLSSEDSPLFLTLSTERNMEEVLTGIQTKGTVVDNDNLAKQRPEFKVNIFHDGELYSNIKGGTNQVVASDGKGNWAFTEEVDWTDSNDDLEFYAHTDKNKTYSLTGQGFFTYKGLASDGKADAMNSSDFIVAHTTTNVNDVNIHFYHALSAIRFYSDEIIITKVVLRNVQSEGEFTYNDIKNDDVDAIFNWGESEDFARTTYVQTYDNNPDITTLINNNRVSETFFIIPQNLDSDDVIITFYFKDDANGTEKNISTKLLGTNRWKAGYIYNYTLTKDKSKVEPSVTLVVNDEMNEDRTEKADVAVENLKSNAAYVRAHVIANWYNTAHKAVAPWIQEDQGGTLEMNDGSDWVKGEDGFYYCLQPVLGYSQTTNFINKASVVGATAPESVYDLRLEMKIIAQGVEYDDKQEAFKATWPGAGTAVISNLKKL